MKPAYLAIAAILLLSACHTIKPDAPDLPPSQINTIPLPDSKIDVPVTIDLAQVLKDFSAKIPAELSGESPAGPGQYRWKIDREPFNISFAGDSIYISDAAHFTGGGYLKNPLNNQWTRIISCNADINMGINLRFQLSNDYSLLPNARLTKFDLNGCDLKIANFNLTPIIKARAIETITKLLNDLNKQMGQNNYRSLLQPAWTSLDQPIKVGDAGYLAINPSAIGAGNITLSGGVLNFTAGVTAKPVFYLSAPPKNPAPAMPAFSDAPGNGFSLHVDVHLDYAPLNKLLNEAVDEKETPIGEKGHITIKDAELYGAGNSHLLIKVKFEGKQGAVPYNGTLYFTCLPVYQPATGDFYIRDIDFDVHTISFLSGGPAAWLLNAAVKKYLGDQVHFNIAGQVNGLKDKLNQALNKPAGQNVTITGSIDSLQPEGILPLKDYILLRVNAGGTLAATIK